MVGANRGCANHSHTASRKQRLIAARARACNQHIGIFESRGCDIRRFEIKHLGVRLKQASNIGNVVFNYDFHFFLQEVIRHMACGTCEHEKNHKYVAARDF